MKQRLRGVLYALLASMLVLWGCGADPTAEANANFVGTWEVDGLTRDDVAYTEDDLALMKSFGLGVYLTLDEGGSATLEMFGVSADAEWSIQDATTAQLKIVDESLASEEGMAEEQEMKFEDGKISMSSEDVTMTFKKIDPADKLDGDISSLPTISAEPEEASQEPEDEAEGEDAEAQESGDQGSDEWEEQEEEYYSDYDNE